MDKGFLCSACHIQLYSFHFFSFFPLALFFSVRRSFVSRRGEKKYCQCPQREFLWRLTGLFVTAWPQLHADNLCPLNWGGLLGVKQTFKFNQLQCSPLPPLPPPPLRNSLIISLRWYNYELFCIAHLVVIIYVYMGRRCLLRKLCPPTRQRSFSYRREKKELLWDLMIFIITWRELWFPDKHCDCIFLSNIPLRWAAPALL